jgi:hypothetical protein
MTICERRISVYGTEQRIKLRNSKKSLVSHRPVVLTRRLSVTSTLSRKKTVT